jgi:hypothetical protein
MSIRISNGTSLGGLTELGKATRVRHGTPLVASKTG